MNRGVRTAGPLNFFAFLLLTLSMLGGGGCVVSLYQYPAVVQKLDGQGDYPALKAQEVYFFRSKEAFPPDLQAVPVCTLMTPQDSQWSAEKLCSQFQEKAAENGANAVVFESVGINKMDYGFLYYTSHATAYRLYKQSPTEDVDLSASQYGTQTPDLRAVAH
jgi:hypothetical protein